MARHSGDIAAKVYVGDLPREATEADLEKKFSYYGALKKVWVARNPPGFAFIEFEDSRDAEDAVKGLDGTSICGSYVRVEMSSGKTKPKPWQRGRGPPRYDSYRRGRHFDPADKCYECGERGHYAYDCRGKRSSRHNRSRSRSRDRRRSYTRSRSRSRSKDHYRRDRSSRSVSRSPKR